MKKISYKPLWKTLIEKNIKNKTELVTIAGISTTTLSKLNKDMEVSTKILTRIANSLDVGLEDIATFVEE